MRGGARGRRRAATLRRTRSSPQQMHHQLERAVFDHEAVSTLSLLQRGADPNVRVPAPPGRGPRSLPASRCVSRAAGLPQPSRAASRAGSFLSSIAASRRWRSFRGQSKAGDIPPYDAAAAREADTSKPPSELEAGEENAAFSLDEAPSTPGSETLLHHAARSGSAELVRALLEHGASACARDSARQTPLHVAALAEAPADVLQLLVSANGARVNAQDAEGDTALHLALQRQNRRHIILLLEAGARADIRNAAGRTALRNLVDDFPQALETAFDHSLRLVRPLGWGARAVQFDFSLFNPCLLDDEERPEERYIETRLMNTINNAAMRDQLFLHPLCQSFLNLKWKVISPFYIVDIFLFVLFVASFNVFIFAVVDKRKDANITDTVTTNYITDKDSTEASSMGNRGGFDTKGIDFNVTYFDMPLETITFFLVAFSCLYINLRELTKLWVTGLKSYIRGPENLITWLCTSTAIGCLCTDVLEFNTLRQMAAFCLLISWTELLFMFGRAEFASMHVMLFVTLIRTLSVFMMVYVAITFAFTSSFFVLFCDRREEFGGKFDTMTNAFFTTVVMSIGELNYEPEQLANSMGGYVIYLLFIFFMLIITMNAMVGMAVNDTRDMAARAEIKLHKKYHEFARIFERHMQWRSQARLWRVVPSVGITLLSMLPGQRLEASWRELPDRAPGWRHRWRIMFAAWRGDVQKQEQSADQLRRWLVGWPGLLRRAARIVLSKHHDNWDRPVDFDDDDVGRTETDGQKNGQKDGQKDGVKFGDGGREDTAKGRQDSDQLPNKDGAGEGDETEEEEGDERDGERAEPDQLTELRHTVLDLKCQLGHMQSELTKIGRVVHSIAYAQQAAAHT